MDDTHKKFLGMVTAYKMPAAAVELLNANLPLVMTGPTGAGKDAVDEYIQKSSQWHHVVTHTTRKIRPGETNGKEYWFVSESEFIQLLSSQSMVEAKLFPIGSQNAYGISMKAYQSVITAGLKPILRIDVHGIEEISKHVPELRPVFVLPPDFDSWMQRLDARGHMSHVERTKRMHSAKEELEIAIRDPKFILVINDDISRVSKEIIDGITDGPSQHRARELAQRLIDHIQSY